MRLRLPYFTKISPLTGVLIFSVMGLTAAVFICMGCMFLASKF